MSGKILFSFLFITFVVACSPKLHQARIVLLPDTQTYAEQYPQILEAQINWILKEKKSISFVLQQGDLTQNNNDIEWQRVKKDFSLLDGQVPYIVAVGNHDMGSKPGETADVRNTAMFNKYFTVQQMSQLSGFGGVFEKDKMENAYYLLQTGQLKWLVLTLEFGPRDTVLHWANEVVDKYPDRVVVVNTHSYLYSDSTRQGPNDNWRPQVYGVGDDTGINYANDGEQIWAKLVKAHPNIRWVFSGHILNSGVGTLISINDAGLPVYQMLANYQQSVIGSEKGDRGWLRIVDMDFKKKTVLVSTYSPYLSQYLEKPAHHFSIQNVLFGTKK